MRVPFMCAWAFDLHTFNPGFPRWGAPTSKVGEPTHYLAKFFPKLNPGAHPWCPTLYLPIVLTFMQFWRKIIQNASFSMSYPLHPDESTISSTMSVQDEFSVFLWKDNSEEVWREKLSKKIHSQISQKELNVLPSRGHFICELPKYK